jgi:hypothetical protein
MPPQRGCPQDVGQLHLDSARIQRRVDGRLSAPQKAAAGKVKGRRRDDLIAALKLVHRLGQAYRIFRQDAAEYASALTLPQFRVSHRRDVPARIARHQPATAFAAQRGQRELPIMNTESPRSMP